VRFLVDAQLPAALAHLLRQLGHEAVHVREVGLRGASDRAIWKHAVATDATLITKDEDFVIMRAFDPSGPSVVWVRIGNCTNRILLARFTDVFPTLISALEHGESVVGISASD